jgi:hypothetical protein
MHWTPRRASVYISDVIGAAPVMCIVRRHIRAMLCDICHKREATVHSTVITSNGREKQDICAHCLRSGGAERKSLRECVQQLDAARCDYCGEPAVVGSMVSPVGVDDQQERFSCAACSAAHLEFLETSGVSIDCPEGEEAQREWDARLAKLEAEAEAYVRQKAQERQRLR